MKVWRGGSCVVNFNPLFNQVTLCIYKEKMKLCISCCLDLTTDWHVLYSHMVLFAVCVSICCHHFRPAEHILEYVEEYHLQWTNIWTVLWVYWKYHDSPFCTRKASDFFLLFFFNFNSAKLLILKVIVSVEFIYWNMLFWSVCCDA